ncbi:MAG: PEP-CTERM sorting domain-containing protein [Actinomycetia bacterium]|nr:PEP-CTERM sorting domain-containing protein [Actinomycetes bacterium]
MKYVYSLVAVCVLLVGSAALAGTYFQDGITADQCAGWATQVVTYAPEAPAALPWIDSSKALGAATGDHTDICSLGDGGYIVLGFDTAIANGSGADFAVFENGFYYSPGALFAELAFVDVSTDGNNWARLPSVSLTSAPVGSFGTIDPTDIYNLAGRHPNAYGTSEATPFDLDDLVSAAEVLSGLVDLNEINYVCLTDVIGDGSAFDSLGNPIYDPYSTPFESGGFDLEAVGVLNQQAGEVVPEPMAAILFGTGLAIIGAVRSRRRMLTART